MDKTIEDRRSDVIAAAYEEFSAKGFAHTQVTMIAEASRAGSGNSDRCYKWMDCLDAA